jgi:hypothetical protein
VYRSHRRRRIDTLYIGPGADGVHGAAVVPTADGAVIPGCRGAP